MLFDFVYTSGKLHPLFVFSFFVQPTWFVADTDTMLSCTLGKSRDVKLLNFIQCAIWCNMAFILVCFLYRFVRGAGLWWVQGLCSRMFTHTHLLWKLTALVMGIKKKVSFFSSLLHHMYIHNWQLPFQGSSENNNLRQVRKQ